MRTRTIAVTWATPRVDLRLAVVAWACWGDSLISTMAGSVADVARRLGLPPDTIRAHADAPRRCVGIVSTPPRPMP